MESKFVFRGFVFFFKLIYSSSEPASYNERNQIICDDFLKLLSKHYHLESIGSDYLWFYLIFQFEYWKKLDLSKSNKKIDPSYILGKRAFDRFLQRDSQYDWMIHEVSRTYDRKMFDEKVFLQSKQQKDNNYDADELYRERYLNTDAGLANCILYTTLFNPNSKSCCICDYQQQCLKTQQKKYPTIYRNRKIVNGTKQTTAG